MTTATEIQANHVADAQRRLDAARAARQARNLAGDPGAITRIAAEAEALEAELAAETAAEEAQAIAQQRADQERLLRQMTVERDAVFGTRAKAFSEFEAACELFIRSWAPSIAAGNKLDEVMGRQGDPLAGSYGRRTMSAMGRALAWRLQLANLPLAFHPGHPEDNHDLLTRS